MNINWDEKPEWALGYAVSKISGSEVWFNDMQYQYIGSGNKYMFVSEFTSDDLIDKQYPPETKPEWNGEGLPPVGTVCDIQLAFNDMGECEITYMGDGVYCYRQSSTGMEYTGSIRDTVFRPIKSDREKWVETALSSLENFFDAGDYQRRLVTRIYDALISGELPMPKGTKND